MMRIVNTMLNGVFSRFCRSHAVAPVNATGGGRPSISAGCDKMQFGNREFAF